MEAGMSDKGKMPEGWIEKTLDDYPMGHLQYSKAKDVAEFAACKK
jgi:hypothetical protein